MNTRLLAIGYGNELRRDDGVGPQVARVVTAWDRPGLRAVAVHQLTPELVEQMAETDRVVFVDARAEGQGDREIGRGLPVSLSPCLPVSNCLGHTGDPCELLALTELLYGRSPEAWIITVPVLDLEFGFGLSAFGERGLVEALRQIQILAGDCYSVMEEGEWCMKSG